MLCTVSGRFCRCPCTHNLSLRAPFSCLCRDLDNIGTTYLANKLSNHLINEITRKLPDIQSYVDKT